MLGSILGTIWTRQAGRPVTVIFQNVISLDGILSLQRTTDFEIVSLASCLSLFVGMLSVCNREEIPLDNVKKME